MTKTTQELFGAFKENMDQHFSEQARIIKNQKFVFKQAEADKLSDLIKKNKEEASLDNEK